jgi:hypothetical protein
MAPLYDVIKFIFSLLFQAAVVMRMRMTLALL